MKYIDADLLRKEIDKWKGAMADAVGEYSDGVRFALEHFTFVLDSLQQEQQEVDLEKEIERFLGSEESTSYTNAGGYVVAFKDTVKIARHFYELGLRRAAEMYDEIEYNRQKAEECINSK